MLASIVNFLIIIPVILGSFLITFDKQTYQVIKKPKIIENKALYITGYTAGWKARREELVKLIEETELNSIVIDIKDASGRIFFDTNIPLADEIGSEDIRIPDLKDFLAELKQKEIYTIGRIVVFQDPYLAKNKPEIALQSKYGGLWRDYKGQSWVDPTQRLVWDYNLDVAKEAVKIGFDEINFDYIRFPSDGPIRQISFAHLDDATNGGKSEEMKKFYRYLNKVMSSQPALTSADMFGMVLWRDDGMSIGQKLADAYPNFDFICPMVYPSHYPIGFEGFENPAAHPYEIIYRSLIRAEEYCPEKEPCRAKIRPWLQDFDLGAVYTPDMIKLQKQATYDSGGYGWLLWNASNHYTVGGLEPNNEVSELTNK